MTPAPRVTRIIYLTHLPLAEAPWLAFKALAPEPTAVQQRRFAIKVRKAQAESFNHQLRPLRAYLQKFPAVHVRLHWGSNYLEVTASPRFCAHLAPFIATLPGGPYKMQDGEPIVTLIN